jgi:hypothetical protein
MRDTGNCRFGADCKFDHGPANNKTANNKTLASKMKAFGSRVEQKTLCRFHSARNTCTKNACQYEHVNCIDYANDCCWRGDDCRFHHRR